MRRSILPLLAAACLAVGCRKSGEPGPFDETESFHVSQVDQQQAEPAADGRAAAQREAMGPVGVIAKRQDRRDAPAGEAKPQSEVTRKIIYTGSLDLIVTDFDTAGRDLLRLLDEHQGYVSKSDVGASSGERRRASWTLRVPVAKFRSFMNSAAKLGHAVAQRTDSQDVTDEFIDLEARLKNKREEEKRLLEHLQKSTGKLEDILAVEKELTRVRGEIEQAQGRLQKLSKLTEMTTVTVTMQERKDYLPPPAPTLGSSLSGPRAAWTAALVAVGKGLLLAGAALLPWSPLLLLVGGFALLWRRVRKITPAAPPAASDAAPPAAS